MVTTWPGSKKPTNSTPVSSSTPSTPKPTTTSNPFKPNQPSPPVNYTPRTPTPAPTPSGGGGGGSNNNRNRNGSNNSTGTGVNGGTQVTNPFTGQTTEVQASFETSRAPSPTRPSGGSNNNNRNGAGPTTWPGSTPLSQATPLYEDVQTTRTSPLRNPDNEDVFIRDAGGTPIASNRNFKPSSSKYYEEYDKPPQTPPKRTRKIIDNSDPYIRDAQGKPIGSNPNYKETYVSRQDRDIDTESFELQQRARIKQEKWNNLQLESRGQELEARGKELEPYSGKTVSEAEYAVLAPKFQQFNEDYAAYEKDSLKFNRSDVNLNKNIEAYQKKVDAIIKKQNEYQVISKGRQYEQQEGFKQLSKDADFSAWFSEQKELSRVREKARAGEAFLKEYKEPKLSERFDVIKYDKKGFVDPNAFGATYAKDIERNAAVGAVNYERYRTVTAPKWIKKYNEFENWSESTQIAKNWAPLANYARGAKEFRKGAVSFVIKNPGKIVGGVAIGAAATFSIAALPAILPVTWAAGAGTAINVVGATAGGLYAGNVAYKVSKRSNWQYALGEEAAQFGAYSLGGIGGAKLANSVFYTPVKGIKVKYTETRVTRVNGVPKNIPRGKAQLSDITSTYQTRRINGLVDVKVQVKPNGKVIRTETMPNGVKRVTVQNKGADKAIETITTPKGKVIKRDVAPLRTESAITTDLVANVRKNVVNDVVKQNKLSRRLLAANEETSVFKISGKYSGSVVRKTNIAEVYKLKPSVVRKVDVLVAKSNGKTTVKDIYGKTYRQAGIIERGPVGKDPYSTVTKNLPRTYDIPAADGSRITVDPYLLQKNPLVKSKITIKTDYIANIYPRTAADKWADFAFKLKRAPYEFDKFNNKLNAAFESAMPKIGKAFGKVFGVRGKRANIAALERPTLQFPSVGKTDVSTALLLEPPKTIVPKFGRTRLRLQSPQFVMPSAKSYTAILAATSVTTLGASVKAYTAPLSTKYSLAPMTMIKPYVITAPKYDLSTVQKLTQVSVTQQKYDIAQVSIPQIGPYIPGIYSPQIGPVPIGPVVAPLINLGGGGGYGPGSGRGKKAKKTATQSIFQQFFGGKGRKIYKQASQGIEQTGIVLRG